MSETTTTKGATTMNICAICESTDAPHTDEFGDSYCDTHRPITKTRYSSLCAGMVIARPDFHTFQGRPCVSCGFTAKKAERRIRKGDTVVIESIEDAGPQAHGVKGRALRITIEGNTYEANTNMNAWVI